VVDRRRQLIEEPLEATEVSRVEGGTAQCVELKRRLLEALRVAAGEDDAGPLAAYSSGCLESDSGAAADHDDGLPTELGLAKGRRDCGIAGHNSSYEFPPFVEKILLATFVVLFIY
jgi:hypothetical protein